MLFRLKTLSLPPSAAECCSDCWVITPTLYSSAPSTISINSFLFLLFGEGEWEPFDLEVSKKEKEKEKERKTSYVATAGTTAAVSQPVTSDPGTLYSDLVRQVKYTIQSYGSTERQRVKV